MDQVSEAVLILQHGLSTGEGPVIAWGNEAAVRCTGIAAHELFGSPLQPLLTARSWEALIAAMQDAQAGAAGHCSLIFTAAEAQPLRGLIKVTRSATGESLGVILTMTATPVPEAPRETVPAAPHAVVKDQTTPSPEGWQEDVIETIRETTRQVAHEFNNALTSIVLPVQLAIRAIPQNGDLYESLEVAHVSAQRASDLAKDFLDCFRPRSAVRSRCAPAALLGRSIRLATCAQPITASLELEAALPEIEVDESQLERVIFNLIRNSVQAMPNGGRLRIAATQRHLGTEDKINLPDGPYIQISVRDWGPGIPDEYLQHLFHGRFTTKPEGNGCGLPICYQIIRDHGGEMLVRSRVNVGTEFLIYLPALPASFPQTSAFAGQPPEFKSTVTATPTQPMPASSTAPPTQPVPPSPSAFPPQPAPAPVPALQPLGMETRSATAPVALAPLLPLTSFVPVRTAPVFPDLPPPAAAPEADGTPHMWSKQPPGTIPWSNVPPVPAATRQNTAAAPAGPEPSPADDSPPSLLVVDDEQGVRTALSQIAKVMGFDVSTVATSDEALQSYKDRLHASRPFSSVLLDLNLRGGLNGMEVFHAIRRMDPEALVVATSGQHAEGDVERFRALGFAGFLAKPYSLEHFDHVMRAALAS